MPYQKVTCQRCGRQLSLAGNEYGIAMPFRDKYGTLKWGIFCSAYKCSKLLEHTEVGSLQNNNFHTRVLYRENREIIDTFTRRE